MTTPTASDPSTPGPGATPAAGVAAKSMHPLRSWLIVVGIFVVLPLVGLSLLWGGRCTESALDRILSPDAAARADTVVKDCGPAMKPATIVRVVEIHDGKDGDHSDVLIVHGKVAVETRWEAPQILELALPKDAVVVARRQSWRELQVRLK